ncbi:MAG: HIT domain-containing protein [Chloroflexi bacterium]|nr:HIT domain-containing protein [Chloroflexota bacterium]
MATGPCVFCAIVAQKEPANIRYEDDEVVVFDNMLDWSPVMLLFIPRKHMTQDELWNNPSLLGRIGKLATKMGHEHCPEGFRILSNFGFNAMQTQPHAHIHVVGGRHLGHYVKL